MILTSITQVKGPVYSYESGAASKYQKGGGGNILHQ